MNENGMQHGIDWDGQDITGFIVTEKFNGCRAYWDGENLWSRGGLKINIPDSWRAILPHGVSLDGEIYDGIYGVYRCGAAIRYGHFTPTMKFMIFDCPDAGFDYVGRLEFARKYEGDPLKIVSYTTVFNIDEAKDLLAEVIARGGEGLILRHPNLKYKAGRTAALLKFKEMCGEINHAG
jgi:DNA ligase-1